MSEKRWAFMGRGLRARELIGDPRNPMLYRWKIVLTPWFGIFVHLIYREDLDRLPHDHPWAFATWILRGSYEEEYFADSRFIRVGGPVRRQTHRRWSFHRFPSQAAHRITATHGKVATLVLVGRKHRTWGFYDGAGRFIDWRDYHGLRNGWNEEQERERVEHALRGSETMGPRVGPVCHACGTAECVQGIWQCPDRRMSGAGHYP